MAIRYNHRHSPLERIVYTKVNVNGKVELVPLELYADGSVKRANWNTQLDIDTLSRLIWNIVPVEIENEQQL